MAQKKLLLILNTNQEYIKHTGEEAALYAGEQSYLFESISNVYIPLVLMLEKFEAEKLPVKIALVLTPVLCTLLEDSEIQAQYIEWLDKKVEFGKKELERVKSYEKLLEAVKSCLEKAEGDKANFERLGRRLVKKIAEFRKKGFVEILATCATDIFLPFYNDMNEVMAAQVEAGIFAYRSFFGEVPDGFWLPELGYYDGVEKVLRAYGMNYTVLDAHSFLFSEIEPKKGIFSPARFTNALVAFGRDGFSDGEIMGEEGYSENSVYRSENCDVIFSLPSDEIESFVKKGTARYSIGYKYWSKGVDSGSAATNPFETENVYSAQAAREQVLKDAEDFVSKKTEKLAQAEKLLPDSDEVSLVVSVNVTRLGEKWFESVDWIEQVCRKFTEAGVELEFPKNIAKNPFELQRIQPYYGSSSGVGYGEDLLSSKNSWMMKFVRKASERMVDLADRFPADTGLKARLLNLGAKELMFAQSSGWAKMIQNGVFPEYAEMRFKQSINDFTAVFDALGSNTVSTEWLTNLEEKHQIFPWINYRIFSKKI